MIKEIILSSMLSLSIGVGAVHYDQALMPNRSYTFNDIHNPISIDDMVDYRSVETTFLYETTYVYVRSDIYNSNFVVSNENNVFFDFTFEFDVDYSVDYSLTGTSYSYSFNNRTGTIYPLIYYYKNNTNYRSIWFFNSSSGNALLLGGNYVANVGGYNQSLNFLVGLEFNVDYEYIDRNTQYYLTTNVLTLYQDDDYCSMWVNDQYESLHIVLTTTYNNSYFDELTSYIGVRVQEGYNTGFERGESAGIIEGQQSSQTLLSLFTTIADIPIRYMMTLFNFDIFGVSLFVGIMSFASLSLLLYFVRKII